MLHAKALEPLPRVEQEALAVEEEQHRGHGTARVAAHAQHLRQAGVRAIVKQRRQPGSLPGRRETAEQLQRA